MATSEKVGSELDPTQSSSDEAKKLKLMEEISQMKDVVNIARQTRDETEESIEEEKEETKKMLEAKKEQEMKKYLKELDRMKEQVEILKKKKSELKGENVDQKPRKMEPNSPKSPNPVPNQNQNSYHSGVTKEDEYMPMNPPLMKKKDTKAKGWSIFNPISWFGESPRKNNNMKKNKKMKKSLSQRVEKKNSPSKGSLFESVGGISNQFKAMFEGNEPIQDLLLDHAPYHEWKKNDLYIWLNKINLYNRLYPNFMKLEITNIDILESSLRERYEPLFEGVEPLDRMKFILYLFYAKHDERYQTYHNKIIAKLCHLEDFLKIDPEILFQQICMNLSDRSHIKTLLEDQICQFQPDLRHPTKLEAKILLMPSPLLGPPSLTKHLPCALTKNDLVCPMITTSLCLGLLIGSHVYIQWSSHGLVFIKRLGEGLNDSHLVELARLELPNLHDFPFDKIADVIVKWNCEHEYCTSTLNTVHFVDQLLEVVVGEMSSNLENLSVRYVDGASREFLDPIRQHGVLDTLPLEKKPVNKWSTLDLLTFYFILGTSKHFTTEFEFDLDGLSLFEADEQLLQLNLLDTSKMSFFEKITFLVFHRVLECLNGYDMRFRRTDVVVYRKFVVHAFRRCVLGTHQKFQNQEVYEVDDKGWFAGTGIVNMNLTNVLPYLCSVERFESKFLSRFPLSETSVQILCLLEHHRYPLIPQKDNDLEKMKRKYASPTTTDDKSSNSINNNKEGNAEEKREEEEKNNTGEFKKLMKFRSAILLNKSMLLDWCNDSLLMPRTRFYRSDPRNFEVFSVEERKDLSHPDMRKKISELIVRYVRCNYYDCGFQKPEDTIHVPDESLEEQRQPRKNSQQFVEDFFKVCDWDVFGEEYHDELEEEQEQEEQEGEEEQHPTQEEEEQQQEKKTTITKSENSVCLQLLQQIRKNGYGVPLFEPSDEFIKFFDLPNLSFFDQYLLKNNNNKKNNKKSQRYRVIFKSHEELDTFVIELLKDQTRGKDLAKKFAQGEYKLLKMYDRLFWHQYVCFEKKGTHHPLYELSLPKMKKVGFARKILPGMGKGRAATIKSDCLCPFGNPYDQAPNKNAFKKRT